MPKLPENSADGGPSGRLGRLARIENIQGMAWMAVSGAFFAVNFGLIRIISEDIPSFELVFFRNLLGFLFLVPWLIKLKKADLTIGRPALFTGRAVVQTAAVSCWYIALTLIPLATAVSLGMSEPIFAALFAVLFLGEKGQLARWAAAAAGFVGAMVIIRPGIVEISPGIFLVLAAATMWGMTLVSGKVLTRANTVVVLIAYSNVMSLPLLAIPAAFDWVWPSLENYGWLIAIGVFANLGSICIVRAYKIGEVTAVAPFSFMRLIFAAIVGFVLFSEIPVIWTWIGGAIIVGAGTYLARREAQAGVAK